MLKATGLPTLLVEGKDDASIYRWLERSIGVTLGSILICSGREVLISIYRKRDTFEHGKLAWLADLDMWRFATPPADLDGIIFTSGYSIENDLYAGSNIEVLLEPAERARHTQLLHTVCRWFVFEILEYSSGRRCEVATRINRVVDYDAGDIHHLFIAHRGYSEPPPERVIDLMENYKLHLRGKTLFEILIRFLSSPGRSARYGYDNIIDICLKLQPDNEYIERLVSRVRAALS